MTIDPSIQTKASKIKLLILDVDGVLTNGKIWYSDHGHEQKAFHVQDGLGMSRLLNTGIEIAIISGMQSDAVTQRMKKFGIQHVYQGQSNKTAIYEMLLKTLKLSPEEAAYVGDDLPDIPVMQRVGLSIAVNNAVPAVKSIANLCTSRRGGDGAVREVCDFILSNLRVAVS